MYICAMHLGGFQQVVGFLASFQASFCLYAGYSWSPSYPLGRRLACLELTFFLPSPCLGLPALGALPSSAEALASVPIIHQPNAALSSTMVSWAGITYPPFSSGPRTIPSTIPPFVPPSTAGVANLGVIPLGVLTLPFIRTIPSEAG